VTNTPGQPVLQISKTSDSVVRPGATLIYTISYSNIGSGPATGVVVTETVPNAVVFDAGDSTPGWSCANGSPPGTECNFALPDLPAGGMGTLLFAVVVNQNPGQTQGGSSGGGSSTVIGLPAPAPAMSPSALLGGLLALVTVAVARLRARRPKD
jgi:uncharacterized repeat protein (TIGR01451 family)